MLILVRIMYGAVAAVAKVKGSGFKVKFLVATWKVGCLHRVAQLCKFNLQWNASYHFLSRVTEQSTKIN